MILASSAKSMSLMKILHILVFALRWARLNSLPSVEVDVFSWCPKYTSQKDGREDPKEGWDQDAPLFDSTAETEAFWCVAIILDCYPHVLMEWSYQVMKVWGGHLIFIRIWKRPFLLTRANAFVRSMKAMYIGICCSLHLPLELIEGEHHIHGRSQVGNHTMTLAKHNQPVSEVCWVWHMQRACKLCLEERCPCRCCSQCCLLCSCIGWVFWHKTCPANTTFPPALAMDFILGGTVVSFCSTWDQVWRNPFITLHVARNQAVNGLVDLS